MKKILSFFMIILLLSGLTACGEKPNKEETSTNETQNIANTGGSNNDVGTEQENIEYIEPIAHNGNIPDGGKYEICISVQEEDGKYVCQYGETLNSGDSLPSTPNVGDRYIYGDYTYTYKVRKLEYYGDALNEWSVIVNDNTKTEYGAILESINGYPITTLDSTFGECTNMIVSPVIPDSVTTMLYTYHHCSSLKYVKSMPADLIYTESTFYRCSSLGNSPILPIGLEVMDYTFRECGSLIVAPRIPETVVDMRGTFYRCTAMKYPPEIPSGVATVSVCFADCESLNEAPVLPEGLETMSATFRNCIALKTVPTIPSTVKKMDDAFKGCTTITEPPVLPNGVEDISSIFEDCTALTKAPVIPEYVNDMTSAFEDCVSLSGDIEINCLRISSGANCFKGVDMTQINIIGSVDADDIEELLEVYEDDDEDED